MTGPLPWLHVDCASVLQSQSLWRLQSRRTRLQSHMPRFALQSFATLQAHPPLALPGQRIGLMGGTFNPPHEGHVDLRATRRCRRLQLDQLWWMVTPGNPLKTGDGPAVAGEPHGRQPPRSPPIRRIRVTGFEAALGSPYTYATRPLRDAAVPARALRLGHGRRQPRRLRPLAALARHRPSGADRGRRPPRMAAEGAGLAGGAGCWPARRLPESGGRAACRAWQPPAWVLLSTRLSEASSTALRAERRAVSFGIATVFLHRRSGHHDIQTTMQAIDAGRREALIFASAGACSRAADKRLACSAAYRHLGVSPMGCMRKGQPAHDANRT